MIDDTDWLVSDAKGAHVARETWTVKFEAEVSSDFSLFWAARLRLWA